MYVKYFLQPSADGELCRERRIDTLWTDIPPLRHARVSERTGFPTQKPLALLERIISCATPADGTVVDLFAGSGTTGEAAHTLGRRFVLGDQGAVAMNVARARLLRAGCAFSVERCGDVVTPSSPSPAIAVVPLASGQTSMQLVSPREPLAWAIGSSSGRGAPFTASFHSERKPGATPVRAAVTATLAAKDACEVRVYGDDGTVGRMSVLASAQLTLAEAR
jgi:DNA methylase